MWGGKLSDLTPGVGSNVLLLLLYTVFGVGFPLVFMWGFRKIMKIVESLKLKL